MNALYMSFLRGVDLKDCSKMHPSYRPIDYLVRVNQISFNNWWYYQYRMTTKWNVN